MSSDSFRSRLLPAAPDGWFDYCYYALSDGALAILRTDRDIKSEFVAWMKRIQAGLHSGPMPDLWNGKARLCTLTDEKQSEPIAVPLVRHPAMDRLADGRWVLAASRAERQESNAMVLEANGRVSHSFAVGDGIEHIQCAPNGTFWVGYFDEGIFGGSLGSGGIVQFNAKGQALWSYNDPKRRGRSFIDDCYAMTLRGNELWTCFYSDFPIVRLVNGVETQWRNRLTGAKALAVDGDFVALAGGYGADESRLAILKLDSGTATLIGSSHFPGIQEATLIQGRGDTLHVVKDGSWTRLSVPELRRQVGD